MNIYRYRFTATCPANNRHVEYSLTLRCGRMILVEEIAKACAAIKEAFHEDIADKLYDIFGGFQVITAHHHGVNVETNRGA